jgi:type III restriction enzyme
LRAYPDFLVHLTDNSKLVLEIKGQESDEDRAKHESAKRWALAVNNWGKLGAWRFHVCRDPRMPGPTAPRN